MNQRTRELAQIHVAIKQLGMSEQDHRSLLLSVCGVNSSADLDYRARQRYITHLKKIGFKPKRTGDRAPADDAQSRKMRALWLHLHELGVVRDSSERALASYVQRTTRVAALQWLNAKQAETVIESLKKWAMRYLPDQVKDMAQRLSSASNASNAAGCQIPAEDLGNLSRLVSDAQVRQTFDPMLSAWEALRHALSDIGELGTQEENRHE